MSILIDVDHGNYACKTPNFGFTSGLMELSGKATIQETDIVEYANRIWTLSNERIRYMRDKTQDDRFFILTLFAIAKELEHMGIDSPLEQIDLAVGLPPEHYSTLKEKFMTYFTFTTRLCESGVNVKVIQDVLGHADISTTMNIYADVTKDMKQKEFNALGDYYSSIEV